MKDLNNKEEITEADYDHCTLAALVLAYYMVWLRCIPLLTSLTSNDYTIKDSFSFVEEVPSFDCAHYMTSFDIESLFTNTPLEETINICVDKLFENNTKVNNLTKESFRSLLELATLDSFFFFDENTTSRKIV